METIRVPFRSIGHVVGRGYSKINEIERSSKAKCTIKKNNVIEIEGTNEARRAALSMIKDCIWNSIVLYNHPIEAIIALQPPLARLKTILFSKYEGIVDKNNLDKAYFILDKGEEMNEDDQLTSLVGNLNLAPSKIIAPRKDRYSVDYITKRIIEQVTNPDNKNLDFKVRVNIGKQLFYPSNREDVDLPKSILLNELLKYQIGYKKDTKATFTSHISFEVAKLIENRLAELEYQKSPEFIQKAYVYLIDNKAQKRFIVSTNITSDGKLIPHKLKSENNKLLFYAFVGSKSALDFRFKVLSQVPSITELPTELYNSMINATYNMDTKIITLEDTSDYYFTITRIKSKHSFIKCKNEFSNDKIKLSIFEVYEDGKHDVQVTITSEALHKVIEKMCQTDHIDEKLRLECESCIEKFVNEVKCIVNELHYDITGQN
ncbi:12306_t:CDS:2 [Cetraspora pellucida]|uniref:12306_t:CDS:1 n=1 Tax=Cetraspora pellucida TaxID=1433469 RepID=A0A9N8Z9Q5_9GLOM|nr:12306_t:CDS:2 [Cetraspora pellucida]